MFFVPVKDGANVMVIPRLTLLPDAFTEADDAGKLHWLFDSVPLPPGITDPAIAFPRSLAINRLPEDRSKMT
jgi:hypothetical protein